MDVEQHKFRDIFKCAICYTDLKCNREWIREFDSKILISDYRIVNIKSRIKVCLCLLLGVLLTRVLAMNLDVSSKQIHFAKTIQNIKCKHTLSYYYNTYRKKQFIFKGIIGARIRQMVMPPIISKQ
jgi:hypothetical protein